MTEHVTGAEVSVWQMEHVTGADRAAWQIWGVTPQHESVSPKGAKLERERYAHVANAQRR